MPDPHTPAPAQSEAGGDAELLELRERAKDWLGFHEAEVGVIDRPDSAQSIIRDLLAYAERLQDALIRSQNEANKQREIVEGVPWDAIAKLPDGWCEDCFCSLLRYNRKNVIECIGCQDELSYDEPKPSLDDDDFGSLRDLIRWAQTAQAAQDALKQRENADGK